MSLSLQGNHQPPAGHVLQSSIGLDPVPPLAKFSGNVGAAAVPMFIDNSLNEWQIGVANGPFSDGDGQHDHQISKRILGRQQKMQDDENIFSCELLPGNPAGRGWLLMPASGLK